MTSLYKEVSRGNLAGVKKCLKNGEDIDFNCGDEMRKTPLIVTAERQDFDVVQELLNGHCNVNAQDMYEWTALHYSAMHGDVPIARSLLTSGAQVNMYSHYG